MWENYQIFWLKTVNSIDVNKQFLLNGFDNVNFLPFDLFSVSCLSHFATICFTIFPVLISSNENCSLDDSAFIVWAVKRVIFNIYNFSPHHWKGKKKALFGRLLYFDSREIKANNRAILCLQSSESCKFGRHTIFFWLFADEIFALRVYVWRLAIYLHRRFLSPQTFMISQLTCRILWWSFRCRFCGTPTTSPHSAAWRQHRAGWSEVELEAVGVFERSMNMDLKWES